MNATGFVIAAQAFAVPLHFLQSRAPAKRLRK